jgi:hypothetical protein
MIDDGEGFANDHPDDLLWEHDRGSLDAVLFRRLLTWLQDSGQDQLLVEPVVADVIAAVPAGPGPKQAVLAAVQATAERHWPHRPLLRLVAIMVILHTLDELNLVGV